MMRMSLPEARRLHLTGVALKDESRLLKEGWNRMKRWLLRGMVVLVAGFVAAYGGDWGIFRLHGSPKSTVTVNRFQTVPLKDNKEEYDYLGSEDVSCSVSLFPQAGQKPRWQLPRNPNQRTTL